MKKITILIVAIIIVITSLIMFFVGRDFGASEMHDYIIHKQEIHEDDNNFYVDLDGERYSYFKD